MSGSFCNALCVISGALILTLVLFAPPRASAEIYKCVEKNGMDRYQNFPCSVDSIGSLPSSPTTAHTTSTAGAANQTALVPAAVAAGKRSSNAGEPRVGMTADEVMMIWGKPRETEQDERWKGRVDVWHYGDGRTVEFSKKQRVLGVHP